MSLNITTYVPRDTPVHRLDPRVKIVLMLAYSIVLFLVHSWTGLALLAAAFAVAAVEARLNVLGAMRQLAPIGIILLFTLLANWYSISDGFTLAGFSRGAFYVVRIVLLVGASLMLTTTTSSTQISQALEKALVPLARFGVPTRDIATVVSIALRFIPVVVDQFLQVKQAQAARGACFDAGGMRKRIRAWLTVFVPLFVALYRRADNLAEALDARCYGLAKATHLNALAFTPAAIATLVLGLAFCVLVAVLF